jgi:hypothetical protein
MRIVSLIPSGTDFVAALGLQRFLVGVSHECDHPIAQGLTTLTSSIIPSGLAPAEIDLCVGEALQQPDTNGSLYRTDRALLRDLKPDLVLTQEICDVCAVNAASVMCDLPPGARVLTLSATDFNGLWSDLRAVASAADCCAEDLIASLQARLDAVECAVADACDHECSLWSGQIRRSWAATGCLRSSSVPEALTCLAERANCHAARRGTKSPAEILMLCFCCPVATASRKLPCKAAICYNVLSTRACVPLGMAMCGVPMQHAYFHAAHPTAFVPSRL